MASKKIEVIIAGDTTKLASALKSAGVDVKSFSDTTEKSSGGLSKFKSAAAAVAGAGGLLALGSTLKSAVSASAAEQEATARMTAAFKAAGVPIGEYRSGIEDAESKGRALGFTNEDVQSGLTNLVMATHNGAKAMADLGVAENLARAKHETLTKASSVLQRAMSGSTSAATKLGITVLPVTKNMDKLKLSHLATTSAAYLQAKASATLSDKQLTAQKVIAAVSKAVGGQADAFSKTGAGALASYHAQLTNVEATLGNALIPILTTLASVLSTVLTWITKHKTEAEALGIAIGTVVLATKAWSVATAAWEAVTGAATAVQAAFNAVMDANPIALVAIALGALVAALIVAYNKVGWFKDFVNSAFGIIKTAVGDGVKAFNTAKDAIGSALDTVKNVIDGAVNFVKDNWKTIAPIILGPVAPLGELVTHFGDVKTAVGDVWNAIKNGVSTAIGDIGSVGTAIGKIPGFLAGIVGGIASDAASIGKSIINGIGDGLKGAVNLAGNLADDIGKAIQGAINSVIDAINSGIDKIHIHLPVIGDIGLPKDPLPHVNVFAKGTYNAPPGWAIVGEQGPELVRVPGGSQIMPAGQTRQSLQSAATHSRRSAGGQYIDMRGSKLNSPRSARTMADRLAFKLAHG